MLSPGAVRWSSPAAMLSSAVSTPIHADPNLDANQRVPDPTLPGSQSQPRFPSTATRQRSSNINTTDPELEFQKTALSSCRSTISQQQAELKRLNECLDVRNKRIMNLESQVGHASDIISDRATTNDIPNDRLQSLSEKVEEIFRKFDKLENSHPVNNIVINSCSLGHAQSYLCHHSSTTGSNTGLGQGSNASSTGSHTDIEQESSDSTNSAQDTAPQEQTEL